MTHGTTQAYRNGCRCAVCVEHQRAVWRRAHRRYRVTLKGEIAAQRRHLNQQTRRLEQQLERMA